MANVAIKSVRGNKGKITGVIGRDSVNTKYFIDVQKFVGVPKNEPRENTAPGDGGFRTFAYTLTSMPIRVWGRVIHNNAPGLQFLGSATGSATITLTTGMTYSGSMLVHQFPISWERMSKKKYIELVLDGIFTGTITEAP